MLTDYESLKNDIIKILTFLHKYLLLLIKFKNKNLCRFVMHEKSFF